VLVFADNDADGVFGPREQAQISEVAFDINPGGPDSVAFIVPPTLLPGGGSYEGEYEITATDTRLPGQIVIESV
jgi:hypothetical protein